MEFYLPYYRIAFIRYCSIKLASLVVECVWTVNEGETEGQRSIGTYVPTIKTLALYLICLYIYLYLVLYKTASFLPLNLNIPQNLQYLRLLKDST